MEGKSQLFSLKWRWWIALLLLGFLFFTPAVFPFRVAYARDITLTWRGNCEVDLAGYKIYYGQRRGGPYNGSESLDGASPITLPLSCVLDPASPELTVQGLSEVGYCFVVTAYDTEGLESPHSKEACTSDYEEGVFYVIPNRNGGVIVIYLE